MVFGAECYSVLIVSSAQSVTNVLTRMLADSGVYEVTDVSNAAAGRRELLHKGYDFVIIHSPLPDDLGTRLAVDAAARSGSVVLLMLKGDLYEETRDKLTSQGVFILRCPTSAQTLRQSFDWMIAVLERLRKLEKKAISVEEKMEEIRLVNRAKWLLIEQLKMTETEAHRHIEKQAMDRCVSKKEIALGIIRTYT